MDISLLKMDISLLKMDISLLKMDISLLKMDISLLKMDISLLKMDISLLKMDISLLKMDISLLKMDISQWFAMHCGVLGTWGSTSVWRLVRDPEEMRFVQHSYTSDVLYGDRFKVPRQWLMEFIW